MPPGLSSASFGTTNNERKEKKMGLDMYAHYLTEAPATAVDFEAESYGKLH